MDSQSSIDTEIEDLSGLAGWMYSDLLVGLAVIFLATITFVPQGTLFNSGEAVTKGSSVYSYSKVVDNPLTLLIQDNEIPDLLRIVNDFKAENSLASDATIVYIQIVGAYNEKMESPEDAVSRALKLSEKIESMYPVLLENASTTFSRTTSIPPNQVVLRLVFAEKVTVGK